MALPPSSKDRRRGAGVREVVTHAAVVRCALIPAVLACCTLHPEDRVRSEIVEALDGTRLFRPRLTGFDSYAACEPAVDTTIIDGVRCALADTTVARVRSALLEIAPSLARISGSSADRVTGWWALLAATRPEDAVRATARLARYAQARPDDARAWADLAAAHLVVADDSEDPLDLAAALDAAERALAIDSLDETAQFNRALALERLFLPGAAEGAWSEFARRHPTSPWGQEAQQRGVAIATPIPTPDWEAVVSDEALSGASIRAAAAGYSMPAWDGAFSFTTATLLPRWAEAVLAADTAVAARRLRQIRAMGTVLRSEAGDTYVLDAVSEITRLADDPLRLRSLAARHASAAESDGAGSRRPFPSEPLDTRQLYDAAFTAYQTFEMDAALVDLGRLIDRARANGYRFLLAEALSLRGLTLETLARFGDAIADSEEALDLVRGVAGPGLEGQMYAALGRLSATLSGDRIARRYLHRGIGLVTKTDDYGQIYRVLDDVVGTREIDLPPDLVARYQDEALAAARRVGHPVILIAALIRHAEIEDGLGRHGAAVTAISEADSLLPAIPHALIRREMRSLVWLTGEEVGTGEEPEEALSRLADVAEYFRATDYSYRLARAYLAQAHALLGMGRADAAEQAFSEAIRETESHRTGLSQGSQRARFLDRARSLFEEMVAFQLSRGDTVRAFAFFEDTRARVLTEHTASGEDLPHVLGSDELVAQIPPDVVLLTYGVFGSEIVAWILDGTGIRLRSISRNAGEISGREAGLREALLKGATGEAAALGARLYDDLVSPIADALPPESRLVIVPDLWLHAVPFAALRNPETGSYLIQERRVSVAPSASWFGLMTRRMGNAAAGRDKRILAIGNPSFDRSTLSNSDLPDAEREALEAAAHYQRREVWVRQAATPSRFLRRAPDFDVIHFAGHAVIRPEAPLGSYLLLASEGDDPGLFRAEQIETLRLEHTSLVVLSACESSAGRVSATEGPASLARAFFIAGVPSVVASLWPVEDRSTADFFIEFHRRLSEGLAPDAALRDTQVSFIEREKVPMERALTWAAFQLFGI